MNQPDNPDRVALEAFLAGDGTPAPMDSSPLLGALECRIEGAGQGWVRLSFRPGAQHVQGNGVVSGGIVATMLDFALAFAGLTTCNLGESAASIGLNVCFLAPVGAGPVIVHASLEAAGYRIAQAEAKLSDMEGRTLATGTGALAMKRNKQPQ